MLRVQIRLHIVQGPPLMIGGGQLFLVGGVFVLWMKGGRFFSRCRILQYNEVAEETGGEGSNTIRTQVKEQKGEICCFKLHTCDVSDNGDFFGDLFTLKVLLGVGAKKYQLLISRVIKVL